jgi:hypothetical protein
VSEVPPGFEPGIGVLQTPALPLGYGTERAGNRARTGDLNLGKVALYQLSYARKLRCGWATGDATASGLAPLATQSVVSTELCPQDC